MGGGMVPATLVSLCVLALIFPRVSAEEPGPMVGRVVELQSQVQSSSAAERLAASRLVPFRDVIPEKSGFPMRVVSVFFKKGGWTREVCSYLGNLLYLGYNVTAITDKWICSMHSDCEELASAKGGIKVVAIADWLRRRWRRRTAEIILLLNAVEVLPQLNPRAVERIFREFSNRTHRILAAARRSCWPICNDIECQTPVSPFEQDYKRSGHLYRFHTAPQILNSGCLSGEFKHLFPLFRNISTEEVLRLPEQGIYQKRFCSGESFKHGIQLDYGSLMCQTMNHAVQDITNVGSQKAKLWRNHITDSIPAFMHFNGHQEGRLTEAFDTIWYKRNIVRSASLLGQLFDASEKHIDFWAKCSDHF